MKNLKYLLLSLFLLQNMVFANYNDIYIANIQYDWIEKSEVEKEAIIEEIRDIVFEEDFSHKKDLKQDLKDYLKDKNHWENYFAASSGYKEYKNNKISAFYYKNQKNIYMYGIQNISDISKIFYYDALGKMRYVDFVYGEYPDYPYYSLQYRTSGKPVSAIYFVSKDTQYIFEPDGTFRGVWYKHNLYDKHSKVILTRTQY